MWWVLPGVVTDRDSDTTGESFLVVPACLLAWIGCSYWSLLACVPDPKPVTRSLLCISCLLLSVSWGWGRGSTAHSVSLPGWRALRQCNKLLALLSMIANSRKASIFFLQPSHYCFWNWYFSKWRLCFAITIQNKKLYCTKWRNVHGLHTFVFF